MISGQDLKGAQATQARALATTAETPQQRLAREIFITQLGKAKDIHDIKLLDANVDNLLSNGLINKARANELKETLNLKKKQMSADILDTLMNAVAKGESIDIEKARLAITKSESPSKIMLMKAQAINAVANGTMSMAQSNQIVKEADARLDNLKAKTGTEEARAGLLTEEAIDKRFNRPLKQAKNNAEVDALLEQANRSRKLNELTNHQMEQVEDFAELKKAKTRTEIAEAMTRMISRETFDKKTLAEIKDLETFRDARLDQIEQAAEKDAAIALLSDVKAKNVKTSTERAAERNIAKTESDARLAEARNTEAYRKATLELNQKKFDYIKLQDKVAVAKYISEKKLKKLEARATATDLILDNASNKAMTGWVNYLNDTSDDSETTYMAWDHTFRNEWEIGVLPVVNGVQMTMKHIRANSAKNKKPVRIILEEIKNR